MLLLWHHNRNIQFFPQGLMQIRYIYFLRSINLLTKMKSAFGTNDCSLLCINSGQMDQVTSRIVHGFLMKLILLLLLTLRILMKIEMVFYFVIFLLLLGSNYILRVCQ